MEVVTKIKQGYKKTKIGWVPDDWDIIKLESVGKWFGGGTPSKAETKYWLSGDIPWVTSQNIKGYNLEKTTYLITRDAIKESSTKIAPENALLMVTRSGILRHTFPVVKANFPVAINQDIKALVVNENNNPKFIQAFLIVRNSHILNICAKVGTTVESIEYEWLKSYKVLSPPLPEQQKIAQILSTWDKAIEQIQNLIEQLKNRKKGLIRQLLTGKTRLKGFDDEWKEYSYSDLLKEVRRPVKWDDEELYHLISVRRRSGGLFEREKLFGRDILTKNLKTTKAGDFLISKMQIVHGASGLTTTKFDDMKISDSYISLRAKDEKILNIEFFSWLSKMPYFYHQTYIASYGVHIEKMTFDFKTFLKLKTRIPSIEEQTAITKILNTSGIEIKTQETYLQQLQDQKKGLMQQLLTGQKRVNVSD